MIAVNGKGGGMRSNAAKAIAPLRWSRARTHFNRPTGTSRFKPALLLLWGLSDLNAQQEQNGTLDFSCSTFPADLSESDLIARYGQGSVITALVTGADDPSFEGTVLFPNQDDARVEIAWNDAKTKQSAASVRYLDTPSFTVLPFSTLLTG